MTNLEKQPPSIIIIFGITGDLAQRKLLPALYHLFKDGLLDPKTIILGVSRRSVAKKELLARVELCVNEIDKVCDPTAVLAMSNCLQMHQMDVNSSDEYDILGKLLDDIETTQGQCMNRLFYLSIPPQALESIIGFLGEHNISGNCQHGTASTRLLVEKPFGSDLGSAKQLIAKTAKHFSEEQLFRIDHYLAKPAVQNILQFRLANPQLAGTWNNQNVQSIEVLAAESIGIENRANFYDQTGALRDIIQSHLLQILALVTMELPSSADTSELLKNKQELLASVLAVPIDMVVSRAIRGQYDGYKQQVGHPNSTTETYASLELYINNPRWHNVPITLTTGKALASKKTIVTINFKSYINGKLQKLQFNIQPDAGVEFSGDIKLTQQPGSRYDNAYERVFLDATRGDHSIFVSSQEVTDSWRIVQPVIKAWSQNTRDLLNYAPGTFGPK